MIGVLRQKDNTMNTNNHYVDNKKLYESIVEYKQLCINAKKQKQPKPPIPDYVGRAILLIAQRLAMKPNFANYSFVDDMISDGVENCVSYFDNFDRQSIPILLRTLRRSFTTHSFEEFSKRKSNSTSNTKH